MEYQKTAEASDNLIGDKIADAVAKSHDGKTTKVSRSLPSNNSEKIINEHDKEIPKERYISPEEVHKIIDDLTLI